MSMNLVSMPSSEAASFASSRSCFGVTRRSGIMRPITRLAPKASTERYAVTDESIPPLSPKTTPSVLDPVTSFLMKSIIFLLASTRSSSSSSKTFLQPQCMEKAFPHLEMVGGRNDGLRLAGQEVQARQRERDKGREDDRHVLRQHKRGPAEEQRRRGRRDGGLCAGASVPAELGHPHRRLRGGETPRGSASRRLVLRRGRGLRLRFINRDLRAADGDCRKVRRLRRVRDTSPRPPLLIYQRLDARREVQGSRR